VQAFAPHVHFALVSDGTCVGRAAAHRRHVECQQPLYNAGEQLVVVVA